MTFAINRAENEKSLLMTARDLVAARKLRASIFPFEIFGEPAWDILLALYVASDSLHGTATPVEAFSGVPLTTTIRWLKYLEAEGLVTRRGYEVQLTDKAR